jgi:hypothetical protein
VSEHTAFGEFISNSRKSDACCVQDVALSTDAHPHLAEGVVSTSVFIHQSVEKTSAQFHTELGRAAYVTPTSYLELLNTFTTLLEERRATVERMRARLATGLEKLQSTAGQVEGMQRELQDLQPVLEQTARDVEGMMEQIEVDKKAAAETMVQVEAQEASANEKAAAAKAIADDAQVRAAPSASCGHHVCVALRFVLRLLVVSSGSLYGIGSCACSHI